MFLSKSLSLHSFFYDVYDYSIRTTAVRKKLYRNKKQNVYSFSLSSDLCCTFLPSIPVSNFYVLGFNELNQTHNHFNLSRQHQE